MNLPACLKSFTKRRLPIIAINRSKSRRERYKCVLAGICAFAIICCSNNRSFSQKVSFSQKNVPLVKVFKEITRQTGYVFFYEKSVIEKTGNVTVVIRDASLEQALTACLSNLPLTFTIVDKTIVIAEKAEQQASKGTRLLVSPNSAFKITGRVFTDDGPVADASVLIEGSRKGSTTDERGKFILNNISPATFIIVVSYVGYASARERVAIVNRDVSLNVQLTPDPLQLQQIIVTTTGNPKKKIESGVAITTLSSNQLEDVAPVNSADIIKAIPGVMVNSSGGDGPGNVFVRGLPSVGGYTFFGVMEDGLPVLPTGFNAIPSPDQNFKTDLTIKTIEAIRGGTAPLVMVNTPGALMNNISYTGADKTYGKFKVTTGLSQDMYRIDGNWGGSMSKKVKYNIGGFYRRDKGIRPPTYTANKGGQFKANFTWNFNDEGYIRVYAKYMNDKVQWQLPSIYAYSKGKRAEPFQGFDMYRETLVPSQTQFDLNLPEGYVNHINLEEGYRTKLGYGGLLFNYKVRGWNIKNNFRYQYNDIYANNPILTAITAFDATKNYYSTDGKQLINPSGYYATQLLSSIKRLESQIINYADLTKCIGRHSITLGGGMYVYNLIRNEAVSAVINTEIKNQPAIILVDSPAVAPAIPASYTNPQGHTLYDGITRMSSVYAMDEFALSDNWSLEAGLRVDHFNLDGNEAIYTGTSIANGGMGFVISGMTPWSNKETYWSASIAGNYKLNNKLAFFLRGTRSYNAFNIEEFVALDFDRSELKKREILMSELGIKFSQGRFALFSSIAYTTAKNLPQTVTIPTAAGALYNQATFSTSQSIGLETEATWQLFKGLNLRLTSTFQDPVFIEYKFTVNPIARPDIAGQTLNWKGNRPQNTPTWNLQTGGTYTYKIFNLFANAVHQSSFWSTSANTYKIPAFTEVTAGGGVKLFRKQVEFRAWAKNLLNTNALTAGNVRGEQFIKETGLNIGQPMIGRPTLPRSIWLSLAYFF